MDTGADQTPPPPSPAAATSAAAVVSADEPRDLRVVREILHSLGLREGDYEEAAVHKLLLFAHRYAGDVLDEAKAYADHAGRESLQADDVRLAIQARVMFSAEPPSREVMLDIAHNYNDIPIPKPCVPFGLVSLPHYHQDMLLNKNHISVSQVEPTLHQLEETEDDCNDDGSDANVAFPGSSYDQDPFGSISPPYYQDMLLNQSHLSVHRVEPTLDQVEEIENDGSNDNVDSPNSNCIQDPSRSVSLPHYQDMLLNQNHISVHRVEPTLDQVEEIKDDGSNDNVASPNANCIQDPFASVSLPHYQDMFLNQNHLSIRGVEPDQVEKIEDDYNDDCSNANVASPDSNYDKENNNSNKQKPSKKTSQLNALAAAGKDKVDCTTELS